MRRCFQRGGHKAMILSNFNLDAEGILDDTIQAHGPVADLAAPPNNIFLTGVTGFVGAFLMHDLLEGTQANIYTLVRAQGDDHARERIRKNLAQYDLWHDSYMARVVPVPGDLKLPMFGLSPQSFQALAESTDVIYHCGSKLSYVAPYEYLKAANVLGTQEALRLAVTTRLKPLHHVSSLGIILDYQQLRGGQETDPMDASMCPPIGYFQTKYVSELLVRIARERGIPTTIHRIGLVVGDSRTGVSNVDDFVARILVGCIQSGYAPDIHNAMDMTPVNFISAAMLYLSQQNESLGKVFHLLNPNPIHWSDIFDIVIEAGFPVTKLPFNEWVEAVEERANPETNPLYPLLPFFHIGFARRMLGVADSHYSALGTAVAQAGLAPSGLKCPQIDRQVITTFLNRFYQTGRLERAPVMVAGGLS